MPGNNPIPPRVPSRVTPPRPTGPARVMESTALPDNSGASVTDSAESPVVIPYASPDMPKAIGVQADVSARGATYYRTTRYIMAVLLLGMGAWFGYDGFKGWPDENARIADIGKKVDAAKKAGDTAALDKLNADPLVHKPPHSEMDVLIQKALAFGLPLLSASMLFWALYNSRGEYRLSGNTLMVPGHPAVRLDEIVEIDKRLWDRKGIAYVTYKTSSRKGQLKLDDFVYDRDPTDEIYKRLESFLQGGPIGPEAEAVKRVMADRADSR